MQLKPYSNAPHRAPCDLDLSSGVPSQPHTQALAWISTIQESDLRRYPKAQELRCCYARKIGVSPDRVAVTAGTDDAIDRICRITLGPGRKAIWTTPGFSMFPRFVALCGASMIEVPWIEGPFPLDAYIQAVSPDTTLLILVAPQNPTGAQIETEAIEAIAQRFPDKLILLDEAYVEFAGQSRVGLIRAYPNLVVTRTLSKAYGGAGLRIGFAMASPEIVTNIEAAGSPFPVAGPSLRIAQAMLQSSDGPCVVQVARERKALRALAAELGDEVLPSSSNSVFWKSDQARWLHDGLAGLGISSRSFDELEHHLRIGCPGSPENFARLERALRCIRRPSLLLLDMDGVLFEVSASYRAAIKATARAFAVCVRDADIQALKNQGDANDDWALTQRLLANAGVRVSLAEVTERFEALYQDGVSGPGLWRKEKLIAPKELLRALAKKLPLGIVTGRPRKDAHQSLELHELLELFEVVICREDAPLKPSPEPIALAMQRAQVCKARAWYVGDTPDDMVAARACEVVPIGHAPPGSDRATLDPALYQAGASRILDSLSPLLELLT